VKETARKTKIMWVDNTVLQWILERWDGVMWTG
jgi:hypothetical protein